MSSEPTYLKQLHATLASHHKLHELLRKRVELARENYTHKTEFERNEVEILVLKTQSEIDALVRVIQLREEYFKKYAVKFANDLDECERKFDSVLANANAIATKNHDIAALLKRVNWDYVNSNIEAKVKLYEQLKKISSR